MPFGPYGPGPWGWGWMVGGWIMMLVFLGLLFAGIVVLVRALTNRNVFGQSSPDSALEVLRRPLRRRRDHQGPVRGDETYSGVREGYLKN